MKRTAITLAGTFGLAVLLLGFAPAAHADVTNPADNPHKVVVKGDDGQTYVDGQDTLPGYDDEECTYIPGAYFDFDANRVYYADGQWIPWTEWDRATGYKDWLAKKQAGSSGGTTGGSSGGSSGGTTGGTTGGSTTGTTKTGTTKTGTTKSGTTSSGSTTKETPASATTKTTTADGTEISASPSAVPSSAAPFATPSATSSAAPSADGTTAQPSASPDAVAASGPDAGASAGPGAGIAILGGLAAVGGIAYGVNWFVRRRPEGGLA